MHRFQNFLFVYCVAGEQGTGAETPLCRTPGTPTSPPLWFSPFKPEARHNALDTLLETKPKVNRSLFGSRKGVRKGDGIGGSLQTDTVKNEVPLSEKRGTSKEERKAPVETQRSLYDQLSASSYTSISGLKDKHGFLCNEYFMRDALLLLKKCLDATEPLIHSSNAKGHNMKIRTPENANTESEPIEIDTKPNMQCSIEAKDCKKRAVTLMQHISEALWCFQLVSHDFIPFQFGKILSNALHLDCVSSDDDIGMGLFRVRRVRLVV